MDGFEAQQQAQEVSPQQAEGDHVVPFKRQHSQSFNDSLITSAKITQY